MMTCRRVGLLIAGLVLLGSVCESQAGAAKLTLANFDSTMSSSELVYVNFYANWY